MRPGPETMGKNLGGALSSVAGWLGRALRPSAFGAFSGANHSTLRGYVYVPTLDSRKEIDSYSRIELIKRARWLYNNVGFVVRCIDGIARYAVGTGISPQARSGDESWNAAAEAAWERWAEDERRFDLCGQVNFYDAQALVLRQIARDGDFFALPVVSPEGGPAIRFLTAPSCGETGEVRREAIDGVALDDLGRHRSYRFALGDGSPRDLPATAVWHLRRLARSGQVRGVTWLYHAVNHMLDASEILAFTKSTVKLSSQLGFLIRREASGGGPARMGDRTTVTTSSGSQVVLQDIFQGTMIPTLGANDDIVPLKHENPSANALAFLNHIARDVSWGIGAAPELLWSVAGLGGTATRLVLADAKLLFDEMAALVVRQFCARCWRYFVWTEIASGRLAPPADGAWWASDWITPAGVTVDVGRDGTLMAKLVEQRLLSEERYFRMMGQDVESEERAMIQTLVRRRRLCAEAGIDYADVFGGGAAVGDPTSRASMRRQENGGGA